MQLLVWHMRKEYFRYKRQLLDFLVHMFSTLLLRVARFLHTMINFKAAQFQGSWRLGIWAKYTEHIKNPGDFFDKFYLSYHCTSQLSNHVRQGWIQCNLEADWRYWTQSTRAERYICSIERIICCSRSTAF